MAIRPSTSEKSRVVVATHNQHKFSELTATLAQLPFEFVPLSNWSLPPVAEIGVTFVENALLKARFACKHTSLPAIADDSGLVVDELNGEPGIYSSRYAGDRATDTENNRLLLERLKPRRLIKKPVSARFVAVLVYLRHEKDPSPTLAEGCWNGTLVEEPRGGDGFGYDPLFLPHHSSLTAAELGPKLKNQLSHRAEAAKTLINTLLNRRRNFSYR